MAKYTLRFHRKIDKFLSELDSKRRRQLAEDIMCLQTFPQFSKHLDIEKMRGRKNTYRLRTDDFRVLFEVNKTAQTINVLKIDRREQAYK
ncbi:MAG: type II toxin-antitoxin system RelE/ParE family toxin [Candidatus Bathyarchaeota archaeon]|nr:type II toxin-antitoxin system RelE/ParE family toxin [Candidatus Bathyarchaeota archaeon]